MRVGDKADLLSDHFDRKQSRESVDLAIRLIDLLPLPSGQVRWASVVRLASLWRHQLIWYVSTFS